MLNKRGACERGREVDSQLVNWKSKIFTMIRIQAAVIVLKYCILLLATVSNFYIQHVSGSAAGQETLIGVVGRDFVMLGADSSLSSSISVTASNVDKLKVLADPFPNQYRRGIDRSNGCEQQVIIVACAGDAADCDRLLSLLKSHISMMEFEASVGCDVKYLYHGHGNHQQRGKFEKQQVQSSNLGTHFSLSYGLEADSVARLARGKIASSLRSTERCNSCLLVAGMVRCQEFPGIDTTSTSMDACSEPGKPSFSLRVQQQVEAAKKVYGVLNQDSNAKAVDTSSNLLDEDFKNKGGALRPRLYWVDEYGSIQSLEYGAHGLGSNFALSILDRGYRPDLSKKEAADLICDCFQQLKKRYVINCPSQPCLKCIDNDGCHLL